MTTPSNEVYRVKQSREEMLRKKREGMVRYREQYPERVTASDRKHYEKNREARIAHVGRWAEANPRRVASNMRRAHLKATYGMTVEQWESMFESQGHRCAICKRPNLSGKRNWHTDHDHQTGKVRGILCAHCNVVLGMARDSVDVLKSAIDYLMDRPA